MDIYLGCRKTDTGSGVHGFKHIVDQCSNGVSHLCNRFGLGAQACIGEFEYFQYCHDIECPAGGQKWLKLAA